MKRTETWRRSRGVSGKKEEKGSGNVGQSWLGLRKTNEIKNTRVGEKTQKQ